MSSNVLKKAEKNEHDISVELRYLMRQFHDVILLHKAIEHSKNDLTFDDDTSKKSLRFLGEIRKHIQSEGHIEKKYDYMMKQIELELYDYDSKESKRFSVISKWLEDNERVLEDCWKEIRENLKLKHDHYIEDIDKDLKKIIEVLTRESPVLQKLIKDFEDEIIIQKKVEHFENLSYMFPSSVDKFTFDDFPDPQSKKYVLNVLRSFYAPKLIREIKSGLIDDIEFIQEHGFGIQFSGTTPTENYALFYNMRTKITELPPIIKMRCESFAGQHADGIKGKENLCAYAGIITNNGFDLSSTWTIHIAGNGTPKYIFGLAINNKFIERKNLKHGRVA